MTPTDFMPDILWSCDRRLLAAMSGAVVAAGGPGTLGAIYLHECRCPQPGATKAKITSSGTAYITIRGPVDKENSPLGRLCGAVSGKDLASAIVGAAAVQHVKTIVIILDSFGGPYQGEKYISGAIQLAHKSDVKIVAFVEKAFGSAYAIAGLCDGIYAPATARIGAVCSVIPWSTSDEFQNLSDRRVKELHQLAEDLREGLVESLLRRRPRADPETVERLSKCQTIVSGEGAEMCGLIDGLADDPMQALAIFELFGRGEPS